MVENFNIQPIKRVFWQNGELINNEDRPVEEA